MLQLEISSLLSPPDSAVTRVLHGSESGGDRRLPVTSYSCKRAKIPPIRDTDLPPPSMHPEQNDAKTRAGAEKRPPRELLPTLVHFAPSGARRQPRIPSSLLMNELRLQRIVKYLLGH